MTEDKMRIATAESAGWEWDKGWKFKGKFLHTPAHYESESKKFCAILPNYPRDLNAIIPLLPDRTAIEKRPWGWVVHDGIIICRGKDLARVATEFYLRTRHLWKETKRRNLQKAL